MRPTIMLRQDQTARRNALILSFKRSTIRDREIPREKGAVETDRRGQTRFSLRGAFISRFNA
jgi:hypothetical protein